MAGASPAARTTTRWSSTASRRSWSSASRSSAARRSDIDSQGVGGTLNIILKEGAELSGGIYRVGAYYNDGETNPSAFLSFGDTNDNVEWGTSVNYQERFNRKAASEIERTLDGEGGAEPAFSAVVEDPDERESTDIAWTGDVRVQMGEGREWFAGAFYMDTDRAETEIGREFAAEDDDGEVEAEASQANQLDAFQETNYGVFTGFESAFGNGHAWEIEVGYDQTEFESVETNWEDDLDFDFDAAGMTDADGILAFLDQTDAGDHQLLRGRSAQRRGPARSRIPRRPGRHGRRRLRAQAQELRRIPARRARSSSSASS